jgi:serine/threonine-protein kinase HipA
MPEPLAVWLGSVRAGVLAGGRRLGRLGFTRTTGGPRLTIAAGGEDETWHPQFARAWFENLLPEGERRTAAERDRHVERGDTFGLLAAIGWECAGAVSILPDDRVPAAGSYRPVTEEEVLGRLDALPRPVAPIDLETRMSLGGVQEKLLLARRNDAWQLPLDGAPSTHILKPEPDQYPGLAIAEAWALRAASAVTAAASADLLIVPGHRPTLVVERYDRAFVDGEITRTHQEDLCQLLGLMPTEKYPRSEGSRVASLRRLAAILVAWAAEPTVELGRLLEHVTVTVALANTDAHAKNLSVVYASRGIVELAPVYDVSPTLFFLPSTRQTALPIGGKWRIDEIGRSHLLAEARAWGMPEKVARTVITGALERFEAGMAAADAEYPGTPPGMREVVVRQFERLATSDF